MDTAQDQESRRLRQLAVFLPNRLGALLRVTRVMESADIKLCAVSIIDSVDHAVLRLVVDQPTLAQELLLAEGYSVVETELLGVVMSGGRTMRNVLAAVLQAELNVHYVYSLLTPRDGRPVLALHVEDPDSAGRQLLGQGFELISQDDLK